MLPLPRLLRCALPAEQNPAPAMHLRGGGAIECWGGKKEKPLSRGKKQGLLATIRLRPASRCFKTIEPRCREPCIKNNMNWSSLNEQSPVSTTSDLGAPPEPIAVLATWTPSLPPLSADSADNISGSAKPPLAQSPAPSIPVYNSTRGSGLLPWERSAINGFTPVRRQTSLPSNQTGPVENSPLILVPQRIHSHAPG